MRAPRKKWLIPVIVLVSVLLVAGWLGWQAWRVNSDLNASVTDIERLQAAVQDGDDATAGDALRDLKEHSSAAAERTQGRSWSVLTHVPRFGDDAAGVRVVSEVLADLSNDGLEPLVRTVTSIEQVVPSGGAISIEAIRRLAGPVDQARSALLAADQRLGGQDPSGYVPQLRTKYRELANQVSETSRSLTSASTALELLPAMLGDGESREYLLVFQNNAEVRATGGLPGAVTLVEATEGKLRLSRQVAASALGETPVPVLPLSDAERELFGPQLGTYFLDANFTPDFPRTAELMKARWEQVYDEEVDGVFSLDPVVISYMLEAVGPVVVGEFTLTSDNVVDVLLHEVYLRYPDTDEQDAYFRQVAKVVFDKVSTGARDPLGLVRALVKGADEGRVYVHSFRPEEQRALTTTAVAGELVTDASSTPQVNVTMNDATGAKMSYFLRSSVRVDSTYCSAGVQGFTGKARLKSVAPADAARLPRYVTGGGAFGTEPGAQLVFLRIYGPVDGTVEDLKFNGKPTLLDVVEQDGRPVATTTVLLEPGQTVNIAWNMVSGPDQTNDASVTVTPGVEPGTTSSTVKTSCAT